MVTIYPEFPGTVFISVSILTSITQCVFISYVENTKHHHSQMNDLAVSYEKEDIHHSLPSTSFINPLSSNSDTHFT